VGRDQNDMLHITKRSEFNIQVHLHELHVCLLYASFSPNEPDMVILSQNKASITGNIPELMPSAVRRRQDICLQLLSELIK